MFTITCPKLAYISGVFMGDGCIEDTGRRASVTITMEDRDVLDTVAKYHSDISGHSCNPRPLKDRPHLLRLRLTDTELARRLRAGTQGKGLLPTVEGELAKREFIAGMMDTDGHARQGRTTNGRWSRFCILFVNSGKWLPAFLELLRSLGVKTGKPTLKKKYICPDEADCYQVGINFRSFTDAGLYFRCARKQAVVNAYLDQVRFQSY